MTIIMCSTLYHSGVRKRKKKSNHVALGSVGDGINPSNTKE